MNRVARKKKPTPTYKIVIRVLAVVLVVLFVLMLASEIFIYALATEATEVDMLKAQQADLEAQQRSLQGELDDLSEKKESAVAQYMLLAKQNELLANEIDNSNALLSEYDAQIDAASEELAIAQADHEAYYDLFCQRASQMEQGGTLSIWEAIFSSRTVTELLTSINDMQAILRYDSDVLHRMEDLEIDISQKESELQTARGEQKTLLDSLREQQSQLEENESAAAAVLTEIQSNIDVYTDQLSAVAVECNDLEADILEAETAQAEAAAKAAREKAAREKEEKERAAREEAAKEKEEKEKEEKAKKANRQSTPSSGKADTRQETPEEAPRASQQQETDPHTQRAPAQPQLPEPEEPQEDRTDPPQEEPSQEDSQQPAENTSSPNGNDVVAYAVQFVGNPYVWGGTSLTKGCDCSGFIVSVYAHFGYSLPHFSGSLRYCGTGVSYSEAQPGDIICYDGHVGIYMGNGQMVNAFDTSHGIIICAVNTGKLLAVRRILS